MPSRAGLITPRCAHPKVVDKFVDLSAIVHLRLLAEIVGKELFVVDVLCGKLQHRPAEFVPTMLIVLLQDVFALGFRFGVRCMSSSADIEVSAVEVGGESKLHEGLSKVHRHICCCI